MSRCEVWNNLTPFFLPLVCTVVPASRVREPIVPPLIPDVAAAISQVRVNSVNSYFPWETINALLSPWSPPRNRATGTPLWGPHPSLGIYCSPQLPPPLSPASPPPPPPPSLDLLGAGGWPWLILFSLKTRIRTFRAALFDTQLENLRFQRLKTFLSNYCFCFAFPVSILKLES